MIHKKLLKKKCFGDYPEVLKKTFFTNGAGCICIVQTKNNVGEIKSYISVIEGDNEESDVKFTADWGSKFPNEFWDIMS